VKEFLKGNYKLKTVIKEPVVSDTNSTDEFEKQALSRLGGSICFVSKKGFLWKGEDGKTDGPRETDR